MNKAKKRLIIFSALVVSLIVVYLLGPVPEKPKLNNELPNINMSVNELDNYITEKESDLPVKIDNESKIIWENDSLKNQTDYCLLYLHGFSASGYEGFPTHQNFASHFHANAYIPRLASHGLGVLEPLLDMTPDRLYDSAKEALQIAHILGKQVVIMSTSTGGTLSLKLAAEFPELVDGLLLLSPNIEINDNAAFLLTKPWGLKIAQEVFGGKYRYTNEDLGAEECEYWNCFYRLEAIVYLQQLVEETMNEEIFKQVTAPVFLAYYYEDKEHQDETVKVDAMLKMYDLLGTPDELKDQQAFNAGTHVIGCEMFSQTQNEVQQACIEFATDKIGM